MNTSYKTKHELGLLVLENTHATFRILWQILMGLALATAIESFYGMLSALILTKNTEWIHSLIIVSINFGIFLLIFLRFFWGDSRYLDLHYMELFLQVSQSHPDKIGEELNRLSGERRFFDIVLLTANGTSFIFLGHTLRNFYHFYIVYAVVMLINVLGLFYNKHLHARKEVLMRQEDKQKAALAHEGAKIKHSREINPNDAPRFWIKNNLIALILMVGTFLMFELTSVVSLHIFQLTMIIICLVNCFLDFWKTWDFYFPELGELISPNIEEQDNQS